MKAQNPRIFCDKQREVCIIIDLAIDPVEKKKRDQKIREETNNNVHLESIKLI